MADGWGMSVVRAGGIMCLGVRFLSERESAEIQSGFLTVRNETWKINAETQRRGEKRERSAATHAGPFSASLRLHVSLCFEKSPDARCTQQRERHVWRQDRHAGLDGLRGEQAIKRIGMDAREFAAAENRAVIERQRHDVKKSHA